MVVAVPSVVSPVGVLAKLSLRKMTSSHAAGSRVAHKHSLLPDALQRAILRVTDHCASLTRRVIAHFRSSVGTYKMRSSMMWIFPSISPGPRLPSPAPPADGSDACPQTGQSKAGEQGAVRRDSDRPTARRGLTAVVTRTPTSNTFQYCPCELFSTHPRL
jgi:hypothetical protein